MRAELVGTQDFFGQVIVLVDDVVVRTWRRCLDCALLARVCRSLVAFALVGDVRERDGCENKQPNDYAHELPFEWLLDGQCISSVLAVTGCRSYVLIV